MKTTLSHRSLPLVLAFAALSGSTALAGTVSYSLDITKFGKLDNSGNQCGNTTSTNAFMFLQNTYTDVYKGDNRIIRDKDGAITADLAKTRDALGGGWGNKAGGRAGMGTNGTTVEKWWASNVSWLEDWAPGKTRYDGQMFGETDATSWSKGADVEAIYPTFQFMWDSLNHKAGIELNIIDVPFKKAHAMTLVGMAFDDKNDDKKWTKDEKLTMTVVDPNDPTQLDKKNIQPIELSVGTDGRFEFKWWQDQGQWYIDSAMTQVAVPGPATWVLAAGSMGLCMPRRRR